MAEIDFFGEKFATAEKIGLMPMMLFAKASEAGATTDDMAGLVAMYDLLEQYIADEEWSRFCTTASKNRASGDEIFEVVGKVLAAQAARPTQRRSDSSDGPPTTEQNSTSAFESRAIDLFPGRPDLQLAVVRTMEFQAS